MINGCLQVYFLTNNINQNKRYEDFNNKISSLKFQEKNAIEKNDKAYALYNILTQDNAYRNKIGTEQEFRAKIKNFDEAKILYNTLSNDEIYKNKMPIHFLTFLSFFISDTNTDVNKIDWSRYKQVIPAKNVNPEDQYSEINEYRLLELNKLLSKGMIINDDKISKLEFEKSKICIYDNGEIKTISLIFGLITFGCLYILRLLYYYVKRLYLYLK